MRGKRSNVDFSKHVLTEIKNDHVLIHKFRQPDTCCYAITFINSCGILAVTGDCGNWIFCREFHPSPNGEVSDSYWCEKLRISSTQQPSEYSSKETEKEINSLLEDNDEDLSTNEKEYLRDLLLYVDDGEIYYLAYAHDNIPEGRDHEFVPYRKELSPMLEVVFDAFDEICRRMKDGEA